MNSEHDSDSPPAESRAEGSIAKDPMWNIAEDQFFDMDPVEREKILAARTAQLRQAILDLAGGATPEQLRELLK
jgi:hypothetical protein